jgi:peptide/nickel transport system substrate-binding protein
MVKAFQARKIDGMAGLNEVPKELKDDEAARLYSFPMSAAVMTFFKTSAGVLSDVQVRQALVQAANVPDIIKSLGYKAQPVQEPLLTGQLSYDARYLQAGFNPQAAAAVLDKDGWVAGADGLRSKGDQPLAFDISAQDTPENRLVLKQLVRDWRQVGARVTPVLQTAADFQSTLEFHSYDALLYGISIGLDPDVFAYWDSSQADVRSANQLNFSEYKSATADAALEAGRTRSDPQLRTIKYQPFLQAWQADAPALALYQPRFLYITHVPIAGLRLHTLNSDTDRYNSVANWEVRTTKVTN